MDAMESDGELASSEAFNCFAFSLNSGRRGSPAAVGGDRDGCAAAAAAALLCCFASMDTKLRYSSECALASTSRPALSNSEQKSNSYSLNSFASRSRSRLPTSLQQGAGQGNETLHSSASYARQQCA